MAKRRASGEGMIRKRPDGRWEGRIVAGHKADGKPIFKYVFADTQKELQPKLRTMIEAHRGVELTEQSKMTLSQWLDTWLNDYMALTIRPSTLSGYRRSLEKHVTPRLGGKKLDRLTPQDLMRLYERLQNSGLSASSVRKIHNTLHHALKAATQEGLIPTNPADSVVPPKAEHKVMKVLTEAQLDIFMEAIKTDELWHDFFYTEMTTGLRRGEICGLMWSDFDAEAGTLNIQRTLHKDLSAGDTKTYAGTRKITLPNSTAELLRKRKETALTQWIFPNPLKPEQPVNPNSAYIRLKNILKNAGLPDIRFHDLRHTFATHALASGVDAKTLSGILGHTKASFTLDAYTHTTGDMQRKAANIVGGFITDLFGEELKPWQNAEKQETALSV